jgi:hypothetical protein
VRTTTHEERLQILTIGERGSERCWDALQICSGLFLCVLTSSSNYPEDACCFALKPRTERMQFRIKLHPLLTEQSMLSPPRSSASCNRWKRSIEHIITMLRALSTGCAYTRSIEQPFEPFSSIDCTFGASFVPPSHSINKEVAKTLPYHDTCLTVTSPLIIVLCSRTPAWLELFLSSFHGCRADSSVHSVVRWKDPSKGITMTPCSLLESNKPVLFVHRTGRGATLTF